MRELRRRGFVLNRSARSGMCLPPPGSVCAAEAPGADGTSLGGRGYPNLHGRSEASS